MSVAAKQIEPPLVEQGVGSGSHPPSRSSRRILSCGALLIFAIAVLSLSLSLRRSAPRGTAWKNFAGLSSDGWIQQDAKLNIEHIAPFLNKLVLQLDLSARPPVGLGNLFIRGSSGEEFSVPLPFPITEVSIPLRARGGNATLSFRNDSPYSPSTTDERQLIRRLASIQVRSIFRIAIPDVLSLGMQFVILLGIGGLIGFLLRHEPIRLRVLFAVIAAGCVSPLTAALLLGDQTGLAILRVTPLALAVGLVLLGTRFRPHMSAVLSPSHRSTAGIVVITLLGAALRLWNLDFGLPLNFYHPDEAVKAQVIGRMMESGSLNPNYFLHPTMLLYATYA